MRKKENRAAELIIANKELAFQKGEKKDRAAELVIANKKLAFQTEEKEDSAAELIIANKELAFQNEGKEDRAAELIIANKELIFQNEEKENRAAELVIANKELAGFGFYLWKRRIEGRDIENIPKVIFLDIKMPKVSGLEVLRVIKSDERTQLIPVVMMTSSKQEKDILESHQLCVNSYVVKPVGFENFSKTLPILDFTGWQLTIHRNSKLEVCLLN